MAGNSSRFSSKREKTSVSQEMQTRKCINDVMIKIREEDNVGLALSDKESFSIEPWRINEKDNILNHTSLLDKRSPIYNSDFLAGSKSRHNTIESRGNADACMEIIKEMREIYNRHEMYAPFVPSTSNSCNARQRSTASINLDDENDSKSKIYPAHQEYQIFKGKKIFKNLMGMPEKKLRGYFGVKGLKTRHTAVEVDEHEGYNFNFSLNTKSSSSVEESFTQNEHMQEKQQRFWWLNTYSKLFCDNDKLNYSNLLNKEVEGVFTDTINKSRQSNFLWSETRKSLNISYNISNIDNNVTQSDSSSFTFMANESNSFSSEDNLQKYISKSENYVDVREAWGNDVKKVSLHDTSNQFTLENSEKQIKDIYQSPNKTNSLEYLNKNNSLIEDMKSKCDFSGIKLDLVNSKSIEIGDNRCISELRDIQENIYDIGNLKRVNILLDGTTNESTIDDNENTRLKIPQLRRKFLLEDDEKSEIEDMHKEVNKRVRLEEQCICDEMPNLTAQEDDNDDESFTRLYRDLNRNSKEMDIDKIQKHVTTDQNMYDKHKLCDILEEFVGHKYIYNFVQNKEVVKQQENEEYSHNYGSNLFLEAIKIENKLLNDCNRERFLKCSTKNFEGPFKIYPNYKYKRDHESISSSDHSKGNEAVALNDSIKELTHRGFDYLVNIDETMVNDTSNESQVFEDLNEEIKCSRDESSRDQSKFLRNSIMELVDENNLFSSKKTHIKSKVDNTLLKDQESLIKDIPDEKIRENEINYCPNYSAGNIIPENVLKNTLRNSGEEQLKEIVIGVKNQHHNTEDKCNNFLIKGMHSLDSQKNLESELTQTSFTREIKLKTDMKEDKVLLSVQRSKEDSELNSSLIDVHLISNTDAYNNSGASKVINSLVLELSCKLHNKLSCKELNDSQTERKEGQINYIRSKNLDSHNISVKDIIVHRNAYTKGNSMHLQFFTNDWQSVLVGNRNFSQIQLKNIRLDEVTCTFLSFVFNKFFGKQISKSYFNAEILNIDIQLGRNKDKELNCKTDLLYESVLDVNKIEECLNELDPFHFTKAMNYCCHKDIEVKNEQKSRKNIEICNCRNCESVEKGPCSRINEGEYLSDSLEESCMKNHDRKYYEQYNRMLKNENFYFGDNSIEMHSRHIDRSPDDKVMAWKISMKNENQNRQFEAEILKHKGLLVLSKCIDESNHIYLDQDHTSSINISKRENLENNYLSNKLYSSPFSFIIAEKSNDIDDNFYPCSNENHYFFNVKEEPSFHSEKLLIEDAADLKKILASPPLEQSDDEFSSGNEYELQDFQPSDVSMYFDETFLPVSENKKIIQSLLVAKENENSSSSISTQENKSKDVTSEYETNFNEEACDDISLDNYLNFVIDTQCKSLEPTHQMLKCCNEDCKILSTDAECQTEIKGLLDTINTCTCMDYMFLSKNEICKTYARKRRLEALNLEMIRNKRLKCIVNDASNLHYEQNQKDEYTENQTNEKTSVKSHIEEAEKDSSINIIKDNSIEENTKNVLHLEEDEWCEINNDRITIKESLDQKVPDVLSMTNLQGREEDLNECLKNKMLEENCVNIREVPSVPKLSQQKSVLRLGLSKRARPRPLHKVQ